MMFIRSLEISLFPRMIVFSYLYSPLIESSNSFLHISLVVQKLGHDDAMNVLKSETYALLIDIISTTKELLILASKFSQ